MSILGTIAAIAANGAQNFGNALIGSYFNRKAASKSNQYALYMSNTAHQREVADLQAAGLNPVLSALGSGASTVATPVASSGDDFQRAQSDTVNSAMRSMLKKEQEQADASIELTRSQAAAERENSALTAAQRNALEQQLPHTLNKAEADALNAGIKAYWEMQGKGWFENLPPTEKAEILLRKSGEVKNWKERIAHPAATGLSGATQSVVRKLSDWIYSEEVSEAATPVAGARSQDERDAVHRRNAEMYLERAEGRQRWHMPKEYINGKMWRDYVKPLLEERRRENPSYLKGYL